MDEPAQLASNCQRFPASLYQPKSSFENLGPEPRGPGLGPEPSGPEPDVGLSLLMLLIHYSYRVFSALYTLASLSYLS